MMSKIWVGMIIISVVSAIATGRVSELSSAAMDGARASIDLCLSIGGMILLWSGVMEIMRRSGLMTRLTKILTPVIGFLFPKAREDKETMGNIATNISANLLGLGNAATPAGIRAAEGLYRLSPTPAASDELCMLIIMNSASLQLIPTTIAAVRGAYGAANPFDIIPAVWIASAISQTCGILSAIMLSKISRRGRH